MDFYILIDEENSLKISPKVLEIMKAKDEEWYKDFFIHLISM